jgi:hypothetical protein
VPVRNLVLAELPAEVDLTPLHDRGEVDQAAIDVAQDDPGLLDRPEQAADFEKRDADLGARFSAAVRRAVLRRSSWASLSVSSSRTSCSFVSRSVSRGSRAFASSTLK